MSIESNPRNFIWEEKYRPRKVADTILPDKLKETFSNIVATGEVPNMLFTGTAGLGKTTIARAICDELGVDYILINGSEEGNIDTLRGKIKQFASSISMSGGYKVIILDEADYLNANSTQPALRGFISEFSQNCRFILTCNFKNRIIEPLHSRCGVYEFNTTKKDLVKLQANFFKRLKQILAQEKVEADDEVLFKIIQQHAPDWRRILSECQRHSINGSITIESLSKGSSEQYDALFGFLKKKDFKKARQWITDNVDVDATSIFRGIYDRMQDNVKQETIPNLILILADYQYKQAFVADTELNLAACFVEIMGNVEFI